MDNKKFFLDKLIEVNPTTPNLTKLEFSDFIITDIETINERLIHGVRYNARVRLITQGKWVGSRIVMFRREDASIIPEQVRWFPKEMLPAKLSDIAEYVFTAMNLEFDESWIETPDAIISKPDDDDEANDQLIGITFNPIKSLFFTGEFGVRIDIKKYPIDYIKNNEIKAFTPLLVDYDPRTHLTPYSFDFFSKMSTIKGWEIVKEIDSQDKLSANLTLVLQVISDLSRDEWKNTLGASSPRPGGYFKYFYNGALNRDKITELFGKDSMLPINMRYSYALILHLDLPDTNTSEYTGYLFIYWE